MPGKSQADIAYGFNTISRLDPRYYAYWMMNNVLGQFGLGGRLADNIRERQGMAYYAYSTFDRERRARDRCSSAPASIPRTSSATIDGDRRRRSRALGRGRTDARPRSRRRCEYLSARSRGCSRPTTSIAAFLQTAEHFGLGLDYDRRLPGLLRAVTLDEMRAAAARGRSNPDVASVAVAGPARGGRPRG